MHTQHRAGRARRLPAAKRLLVVLIGVGCSGGVMLAPAATPAAADDNFTCSSGFAPALVTHDLVVPPGGSCTLTAGDEVGHDVTVQEGATLNDEGGQIEHDLKAEEAAGIGIGSGASIGHDVAIKEVSSFGPGVQGDNFVCSTSIGHDLTIEHSGENAGAWIIGDTDPGLCGRGVTVGHDLKVDGNANTVDVSNNQIGHDMDVSDNAIDPVVESNEAGHDAKCQDDVQQDGDGSPNVAGHDNSCE